MTAAAEPSKDPAKIRGMFAQIAPVYDTFNHLFTMHIDRYWRWLTVRKAIRPSDKRVLDVACGTGDLTAQLRKQAPVGCQVIGLDFCLPMLRIARDKTTD